MKYLSTLSRTMPLKKQQSLLLSCQVCFDFTIGFAKSTRRQYVLFEIDERTLSEQEDPPWG